MEERRPRERELVLAPNEYAYVLDTTKGHINCYVGPNKTSLAQTDQPVAHEPASRRFVYVELKRAVQLFPEAPRNSYLVLENPAVGDTHPTPGVSNALTELRTGEKVNVRGPVAFPLWPGQTARVVEGHRLRSNQYIVVRIFDPEAAAKEWAEAVGDDEEAPLLSTGELRMLTGADLTFFIPPNGVEVVPDDLGNHVRDALVLRSLEYCVIVGEDGRRRYVRGESVVFVGPHEELVMTTNTSGELTAIMNAFELSETTGVHVKVVAPYEDDDGAHQVGDELFITGAGSIYFPRQEHVVIRQGEQVVHQAVAIPRGDGRYVLDRTTGEVSIVRGPRMFLPDPRKEVIVRRILDDDSCRMLYPGNTAALAFNRRLRHGAADVAPQSGSTGKPRSSRHAPTSAQSQPPGLAVQRPAFVEPRTITLDTRFAGVVGVDVWPGYAVQIVDRVGQRRVVVGPATVLLEFDEKLTTLRLSTGTPKSAAAPLATAYLQIAGNRVSDIVEAVTADLVAVELRVEYRVRFEGPDPDRWFGVEDYVGLLTDRAGSLIKARLASLPIVELRQRAADIVRDILLGKRDDEERPGRSFSENGMCLHEVDVVGVHIGDESAREMLESAQADALEKALELAAAEAEGLATQRMCQLLVDQHRAEHDADAARLEMDAALAERRRKAELATLQAEATLAAEREQLALAAERRRAELVTAQLTITAEQWAAERQRQAEQLELRLTELRAQVEAATAGADAFGPHLVSAINRLGDEQLLAALSENFGELAAAEGRGLLETARKFMDFVPAGFMPTLPAPENGVAKPGRK